ncbi:MAG: hypothetical protein PVG85_07690 [Deltaproteobacteria bacterium]|jgi:hypothetical protein
MDILPGRILSHWFHWNLGPATHTSIELRLYHFTGVQAGLAKSSADTDEDTPAAVVPSGASSGEGGGGCFIATQPLVHRTRVYIST